MAPMLLTAVESIAEGATKEQVEAAWAHVKSALEQTSNCCDAGQGVERWIKDLYEAKEEEAAAAAAAVTYFRMTRVHCAVTSTRPTSGQGR